MTLKSIFLIVAGALFLWSCTNDILDVDASDVSIEITFLNVDSVFVHADSTALLKAHADFKKDIRDVYEFELGHCLSMGNIPDSEVYPTIQKFVKDPYIERLEKRIAETFEHKGEIEASIRDGFRHVKYHFPSSKTPRKIVYLNTLFAASAAAFEKDMSIGMERYLGAETDVIKEVPGLYDWVKEGMDKRYLERDVVASWLTSNVMEQVPGGTLAEGMIYWGKVLVAVEGAFYDKEKHLILRYSEEDYKWALENEYAFWKYLVEQKLLFSKEERTLVNMLKEGPFTPGLPEKGPDRLGQFLGWRMVHQYMKAHDELTLQELMEVDYNEILQAYEIE